MRDQRKCSALWKATRCLPALLTGQPAYLCRHSASGKQAQGVRRKDKSTDDRELWPHAISRHQSRDRTMLRLQKKHGRGLQLRYPGRARVPHLTEWNGHHGAKIQTHGSWCGAAKPGTASGNAPNTAGASRGTLGGGKTISPHHQRLQMLGDSDCTLLPRASGRSFCSARGCSPHQSNPLIQTL